MNESILYTIKTLLGPNVEDPHFDTELIPYINTEFWKLWDRGVGPASPFKIEDASSIWSDFMDTVEHLEAIKTCVYYGVKLKFDPPTQTAHLQAMKEEYAELQYRLQTDCDKT